MTDSSTARHRLPDRSLSHRRSMICFAASAIIALWRAAWQEVIPFLDYDIEIRKVICSTNAIVSLNARYRRAVRA